MISTIASAYDAAADHGPVEAHFAWQLAWQRVRDDWHLDQPPAPQELAVYLADVPAEEQRDAACDLIAEHLRLSWQAGRGLELADYSAALAGALPWLAHSALLPADLVEDEFLARSAPLHGDHPQLADYATRFGDRPDVMARLANRCLAEQRYVKLRALGAGALAVVHEAYDRLMHRLVAIKEVRGSAAGNSRQRLLTEMQLAAELNHPGIVSIYDFGQSDQETYFVMELISGRLLSERIGDYHARRSARSARQSRRLLQELIECLIQMCDAVAHAHGCGILHRDLKPGNVIVSDTGEAVIVDWGLARRLKGGAKAACECNLDSMIVGTPQYMAPEQAEQQECMASDVFSLGGILYEVLTGRPPYEWAMGSLPLDWAQVIGAAQISAPRQLAPGTPRVLDAICTKALAKSTADRYSTATELADDLRQFLHTENNARGWLSWLIPPVE